MLLDNSWGEVGVPYTVTSDRGSQFVSQLWGTLCARLGVRCAFSQAHRPQANGRAEVCGRIILGALRKLHTDGRLNWVEALPRALRIHHDTVDETGVSPYVAVFGRERNLAGAPYQPPRECPTATEFCRRMELSDRAIAEALNEAHAKVQAEVNQHRRPRPPFVEGDWVWLMRPPGVTGPKMDHWWKGPYRVAARTGQSSYTLFLGPNQTQEAHLDQLKPCHWDMDLGSSYPLVWRKEKGREAPDATQHPRSITGHRFTDGSGWEFLKTWSDDTQATPTWEPASKFFQGCDELWMTYILENGLDLILESEVSQAPGNQNRV